MKNGFGGNKRLGIVTAVVALVLASSASGLAQERMPVLSPDNMTDAQKEAVAEYREARNVDGMPAGPYLHMLRTPEVMTGWHHIGHHLNSFPCSAQLAAKELPCVNAPATFGKTVMGDRLTQFAIVLTMAEWGGGELSGHSRLAEFFGVKPVTVKMLGEGRRPDQMAEDEAALYDFVRELMKDKSISDATYARTKKHLGDDGIIETINAVAFYSAVGMVNNVARSRSPAR